MSMAIFLLAGYSLPGDSFRELQVRKALSMAETRVLLTRDAGYNPYRVNRSRFSATTSRCCRQVRTRIDKRLA